MVKSKVGIMSMQRVINYGSFLQAYGLKKIVENITGQSVEFIDYEFGIDLISKNKRSGKKESLIYKIKKNRTPWNYFRKMKYFKQVRNNLIKDMKTIGVDLPKVNQDVDTLIIGSDEVFNCLQPYPVGYSKQLFGEGYEKSVLISYAASFGNTQYDDLVKYDIEVEIKKMLSNFKGISVRDENSAYIVRQLLGIEPEINMDPVLMYNFIDEMKLYTTNESGYIIIYAYTGRLSKAEENYIKEFARDRNKRIISIGHYSSIADENITCIPFYVFSYFKNADYVITDTFHGTVFSIKMNTKFCTIIRDSNRNKLSALLERLGRLDRRVEKLSDIERLYNISIDYSRTNAIIENEKQKTITYLKDKLQNE